LVRDPDELIGLTFDELFPLVAPEDPARREELRSRLVAAVQTRQPQLFDDVALSAAGDRLYYERIDVPVLEADGRCSHVLRVSHDVTRLRAAEEALHQHFREQAALLRIAAALRDTSDLAAALDTVVAEV
jgi:PAS domain-containing protein